MREKAVLASLMAICCVGCWAAPSPETRLLGVWQIQVIENITASGSSINNSPQPSLAIFTASHYSLIWMPGTTGMRAFKQRWLPTDEEKIQRYGEIVANAGTHTPSDSTITLQPAVSRVPEFMAWRQAVVRVSRAGRHADTHLARRVLIRWHSSPVGGSWQSGQAHPEKNRRFIGANLAARRTRRRGSFATLS